MCFYTRSSKIRIVTKDIVCYKSAIIKTDCCIRSFQKFEYKYNKKYSGKSKWKLFIRWLFDKYVSSEEYHSYTTSENTSIKCIIPKWSLYLINETGTEYVSTSIKILKP